jgi:hypothetical protein
VSWVAVHAPAMNWPVAQFEQLAQTVSCVALQALSMY